MTRQQKIKKIEIEINDYNKSISIFSSFTRDLCNDSLYSKLDNLFQNYKNLSNFTKDIKDYNKLIEIGIIIDNIYFYDDIQKLIVENPDKKIEIYGNIQNLFYKVEENKYRALEKDDLILQSEKVNKGHLYSSYTEISKDNMSNFYYDKTQDDMCKYLFNDLLDDTDTMNNTKLNWRDCIIFILCFIPTMTLLGIGLAFILKYISNLMI